MKSIEVRNVEMDKWMIELENATDQDFPYLTRLYSYMLRKIASDRPDDTDYVIDMIKKALKNT